MIGHLTKISANRLSKLLNAGKISDEALLKIMQKTHVGNVATNNMKFPLNALNRFSSGIKKDPILESEIGEHIGAATLDGFHNARNPKRYKKNLLQRLRAENKVVDKNMSIYNAPASDPRKKTILKAKKRINLNRKEDATAEKFFNATRDERKNIKAPKDFNERMFQRSEKKIRGRYDSGDYHIAHGGGKHLMESFLKGRHSGRLVAGREGLYGMEVSINKSKPKPLYEYAGTAISAGDEPTMFTGKANLKNLSNPFRFDLPVDQATIRSTLKNKNKVIHNKNFEKLKKVDTSLVRNDLHGVMNARKRFFKENPVNPRIKLDNSKPNKK